MTLIIFIIAASFGASILLAATLLFNDDFREGISETKIGVLGYLGICIGIAIITGAIGQASGNMTMFLVGTGLAAYWKRKAIFGFEK